MAGETGTGLAEAQINRAYRLFYGDGMNLGEVAADLGCGVYALSPWLYRAAIRIGNEAVREEREAVARRALAQPTRGEPEGRGGGVPGGAGEGVGDAG